MSSKGDYALEQEKYSAELIEKASNEKDGLLKFAKDMATKELESYNEEKRREYDNKVTELNVNDKFIEEIENKSKIEVEEIIINVKYEVPEVVKGFFEEKFGIVE